MRPQERDKDETKEDQKLNFLCALCCAPGIILERTDNYAGNEFLYLNTTFRMQCRICGRKWIEEERI